MCEEEDEIRPGVRRLAVGVQDQWPAASDRVIWGCWRDVFCGIGRGIVCASALDVRRPRGYLGFLYGGVDNWLLCGSGDNDLRLGSC
jgi:hypothetical protein